MEWKWTKGEPYERTRRYKQIQQYEQYENKQFGKNMELSAYTLALHHDENTWDIFNQITLSGRGATNNKRIIRE